MIRAIVENAGMEDVFRSKVVLQSQEVVRGPLFERVGVGRKLFHHTKRMLHADGVGKPETPALDRPGKGKSRIPITQMHALLNVDPRGRIGGPEAPAIVSIRSYKAQNIRAR